jgi:FixJ family two-component response regulator
MRRQSESGRNTAAGCVSAEKPTEVVYIIDDDVGVRESLAGLLSAYQIPVVSFGSAAEFLDYERSDAAACLILDLQLPEITGLELQSRLDDGRAPPIIFISGRGDIPSTVRAMKAGAIEFLTKPVNPEVLMPTIAAALARDRINREKQADMAALKQRWALLSPREREVLPLVVKGLLNKQSAAALGITEVTLQIHRSHIMKKMDAGSFADLVRMAEKLGVSCTEH